MHLYIVDKNIPPSYILFTQSHLKYSLTFFTPYTYLLRVIWPTVRVPIACLEVSFLWATYAPGTPSSLGTTRFLSHLQLYFIFLTFNKTFSYLSSWFLLWVINHLSPNQNSQLSTIHQGIYKNPPAQYYIITQNQKHHFQATYSSSPPNTYTSLTEYTYFLSCTLR
jgi:hypothetical protein